jgi:hypothetical protein
MAAGSAPWGGLSHPDGDRANAPASRITRPRQKPCSTHCAWSLPLWGAEKLPEEFSSAVPRWARNMGDGVMRLRGLGFQFESPKTVCQDWRFFVRKSSPQPSRDPPAGRSLPPPRLPVAARVF